MFLGKCGTFNYYAVKYRKESANALGYTSQNEATASPRHAAVNDLQYRME
jgi:hypothetical protein